MVATVTDAGAEFTPFSRPKMSCGGGEVVDVLIVNYLSGDAVCQAAAAVAGPGVRVRVWDNSGELIAGVPDMAIEGTGDNVYFAAANQAMYASGSAPFVLLLNPDVTLSQVDLVRLVDHLISHPEAWAVSPRLLWPDGRDQNYLRRLPTVRGLAAELVPPLRRLFVRSWVSYRCFDVDLGRSQPVEQPPAACLLLRRSDVGEVLFKDSYPLFFNDVDLCRRMAGRGPVHYLASVTAKHVGGGSIKASQAAGARTRRMYDDALVEYARRNLSGWWVLVPLMLVRRLALSVRRIPGR